MGYGTIQLWHIFNYITSRGWGNLMADNRQSLLEGTMTIALTLSKLVKLFEESRSSHVATVVFQSLLVILVCSRLFEYMEAEESWAGQLATMKSLGSAVASIFLAVWFIIHMAFVIVFFCLFRDQIEEFNDMFSAFAELYVVLVGELELWNSIKESSPYVGTMFFILYTIISTVLLLNWLIAMMNHRFEAAASEVEKEGIFARAKLILRLEREWVSDQEYKEKNHDGVIKLHDYTHIKPLSQDLSEFAIACEVHWGDMRHKLEHIHKMLSLIEESHFGESGQEITPAIGSIK